MTTFIKHILFVATLALSTPIWMTPSHAQSAGNAARLVTEVEGIREYRLDNGLQVLLFPDASQAKTTVNITYRVGSRHENYGETGMAHLLEHMLFKGTPTRPSLWQEMADRGFVNNGTTWFDRTNYYESFTATDENLKWAIDMEADRMVNSKIAAEDLATEMTVVRNEFEMGENNPFQVMLKRIGSVAYDWHAYGKSTIGNRSDIENVGIENLRRFYRTYYQPDNATLLIGGKFDPDKALAWVNAAFGSIPKPTRTLPTLWTAEPGQDGERSFYVRRVGDVQILLAAFKVPPGTHADYAALQVLAFTLSDEASGRLKKSLVDTQLATQAFSFSWATHDPGLLYAGAVLRGNQDLEKAQNALLTELNNIAQITPEEVVRAQNALTKSADETVRAPDRLSIAVSEAIAQGDWRLFFFQRDQIKRVKADDVSRVAKAYLKRDNRTLGIYVPTSNPDRATIPARPDVVALLKDYKGDAAVKSGEAFDATPANLDARTQRFTLANGMQVALLPKSTRGESVNVNIRLRAGSLETLKGQSAAARLAGPMLMRGTTSMSRAQIKDKFDAIKATADVSTSGATIATTRPNVVEAIKLAAHVLRNPSFPKDEFDKLRQEILTNIEFSRKEPQTVATDKMAEHFRRHAPDDPRYSPTSQESAMRTEAVTREAVMEYYKRFVGAAGGQAAIIGDFDVNEMKALLEAEFGAWRAPVAYARIANELIPNKPAEFVLNTPDKENGFFLSTLSLDLNDTHPDYHALLMVDQLFGGSLSSRLFTRIREKEGLSYAVGSQLDIPAFERGGNFLMYAIAAPSNMSKVLASIKDETAKIAREGFTADELAKAKTSWLQERQVARAADGNVANGWISHLHTKRSYAFSQANDDKVKALTLDQVNAAFRNYIKLDQMTFFRALDESKAK
jgi:zinc protease